MIPKGEELLKIVEARQEKGERWVIAVTRVVKELISENSVN